MKKRIGVCLLAATLFFQCQKPSDEGTDIVRVSFVMPEEEGEQGSTTIRIFECNEKAWRQETDSVRVERGKESIWDKEIGKGTNTTYIATLGGGAVIIIGEKGEIVCDFNEGRASGTPLNDEKNEYRQRLSELRRASANAYDSLARIEWTSADDRQEALEKVVGRAREESLNLNKRILKEHPGDALAEYIFWQGVIPDATIDGDAFKKLLAMTDERVAKFPVVKEHLKKVTNAEETQVGMQYKDIEAETANGETEALSHLVDSKGYSIVHIFDPRDNNTPIDLGILTELRSQHSKDISTVVSYCEGIDSRVTRRIAEKFQLGWPIFNDYERRAENTFGVFKLPAVIIIDKEGKIAARDIDVSAARHWIEVETKK
ncbi:MAG: hypothetical protein II951_05475 [Bacteroidales bacterium]|nr:hypothetical protein [Bacteroidales bacterium]